MTRLSDLTPEQIRAMIRLDDGFPHEDSVGADMLTLPAWAVNACDELVKLGLAEWSLGRHNRVWYRLTEAGRQVREEGGA